MVEILNSKIGRGITPAFFLASLYFLSACAVFDFAGDRENLFETAERRQWVRENLSAGQFSLLSFHRVKAPNLSKLTVYIEGDGEAWLDRNTVSPDPTPDRPVGLRLALQDPSPNILYISRPCQNLARSQLSKCPPKFWTSHRFSSESVTSLNAAVDIIKHRYRFKVLELIGYSGGGGIAALITARRNDVERLVTIAANLDTDKWTKTLDVSPMSGSMNPSDIASQISQIEQFHFIGQEDEIVPAEITRSFLNKSGASRKQKMIMVPRFSHECCWHLDWMERISKVRRIN